jgi:hypothetical protein
MGNVSETRRPQSSPASTTPVQVQVVGVTDPDIAEYAERRLREAFLDTHFSVLHARVRVSRHADPALPRPVVAQANLDVDGRFIRAQVSAPTAREAVDQLHDRLRKRMRHDLQRAVGNWEDRRGRQSTGAEHAWRHGDERSHRLPYFPRPAEERDVVRHKSIAPARSGLDDAAAAMDDLDFDFHFFTEAGSGQDSVLYRAGPSGYRLAQVQPRPDALAPHAVPATVSEHPAAPLSTAEAVTRMAAWEQPFLFFLDRERNRGALLYHRYDGHYGLIAPPGPATRRQE